MAQKSNSHYAPKSSIE